MPQKKSRPVKSVHAATVRPVAAVRPTASKSLDTFPSPSPQRDFLIQMDVPEFTCVCPLTGQPDFARFTIEYIPEKTCIELKSLKLYMWSFRDEGAFHEAVTNRILDDLSAACLPRFMRVRAHWYVRGGIFTTVTAEFRKKGWKAAAPVDLTPFEVTSPMAQLR